MIGLSHRQQISEVINLQEKTAKALYAALKELKQSRAIKKFVDIYEREELGKRREEPEVNEIYRDIFGNRYVVFNANFLGVNDKPYVALARVDKKDEASITDLVTVPLEDFMNPTLKRE